MMRRIIFTALMALSSTSAYALDPLCTNTNNLSIPLCPSGSTDWYQSYTTIVNSLDIFYRTDVGSFTVTGALLANSASLTTALPVASGGTAGATASAARTNLSAAASGANTDLTSISGVMMGSGNVPAGIVCTGAGSADFLGNHTSSFTANVSTTTPASTTAWISFSTFTFQANAFTQTGAYLHIHYSGTVSASSNAIFLGVYGNTNNNFFKSTSVAGSATASAGWSGDFYFQRTGTNTQVWNFIAIGPTNNMQQGAGQAAFSESAAMTFSLTCKNNIASQGDCSFLQARAEVCAPPL